MTAIVAKATLALLVTLFALRLARHSRASVRHLLLTALFAVLLVLPIAAMLAPSLRVEIGPLPVVLEEYIAESVIVDSVPPGGAVSLERPMSAAGPGLSLTADLLTGAWLGGLLLFAIPLLLGLAQVGRLRRTGLPWPAGQRLVDSLAREAGLRRSTEVLLHASLAVPATCGITRHAILFPIDADSWPHEDILRAAVHEVEHIRRADCCVNAVTRAICAAYWFHPLVWIAWRRLGLEAERACDDAVLRRAEAAGYASQLVELAGRLSANPRHPLLAMASRGDLVQRVKAVLDERQARGGVGFTVASAVALAACALVVAISPLQAVSGASSAAAAGLQSPGLGSAPQFEVATVRINRSGELRSRHQAVPATGRLTITNVTVGALIQDAYDLQLPSQIVDMPDWARSQRVDIVAKAAFPAPVATLQRMLQPLLAEHFKLKVRRETRELEALALVASTPGRRGPQLRKNDDACDDAVGTSSSFALAAESSGRLAPCGILPGGAGRIVARGLEMSGLADLLAPAPRRVVIDRTGLAGRYDIDLTYTPEAFSAAAMSQRPGATLPPGVDPSGPPLATALQEQLGLKLQAVRVPVEVLVIEHAEPLSTGTPQAGAPPPTGRRTPAFEAASVKRNTSGETRIRFETPPGRLTAVNVPLRFLIRQAYRLPEARILGGPSWLDRDRFDILATAVPSEAPRDTIREMLRALLTDRFGLGLHAETRDMPVYSLRMMKDEAGFGPHLRRSTTDCAGRGSTVVAGRVQCGILVSQAPASASLRGGATAFADFVRLLGDFVERPLVDETGLTGVFDLELQFSAERSSLPGAVVPGGLTTTGIDGTEVPTLATALREQLGLRLEAQRGRAEVLVVDRVSEPSAD
jgi:uncharacterized protein (TIGR03435 family)